jgi:hypothetical protein
MKTKHTCLFMAAAAVATLASAGPKKIWDGRYSPAAIHYLVYSNDLDEAKAPTPSDQRVSIAITGELAKQMFEAIGPDLKVGCGTTLDMRQRQRGDLDCSWDKDQPGSPYTCHLGIDLRKGKSIAGSTC